MNRGGGKRRVYPRSDGSAGMAERTGVGLRRIPFRGHRSPAVDLGPESGIVDPQMEGVEAIHDLAHQRAHLVVIDPRDLGPWNPVALGVLDDDVAAVARAGDGRPTRVQILELRVAHAGHGRDSGKLGGNPVFVRGAHETSLRWRARSRPELVAPPQKLSV